MRWTPCEEYKAEDVMHHAERWQKYNMNHMWWCYTMCSSSSPFLICTRPRWRGEAFTLPDQRWFFSTVLWWTSLKVSFFTFLFLKWDFIFRCGISNNKNPPVSSERTHLFSFFAFVSSKMLDFCLPALKDEAVEDVFKHTQHKCQGQSLLLCIISVRCSKKRTPAVIYSTASLRAFTRFQPV